MLRRKNNVRHRELLFFVTEELQSQCLTDFIRQNWPGFERHQKEKVVTGLATFIRKIHALNISLPDLYVWHIFITEKAGGQYCYAVIDLHRMSRNVISRSKKIKNLGRLHRSMLDSYFDEELKQLFVESYAADDRHGDINGLMAQVKRYSDAVSAKCRQRQY